MNDRWIMKDILTTAVCIAVFSIAGMGIYWKFEKWLTTPEQIARPVPAAEVTPAVVEKAPTELFFKTTPTPQSTMTVSGFPIDWADPKSGRYARPKTAEEITIHLWTADGRKWVAKWEEQP